MSARRGGKTLWGGSLEPRVAAFTAGEDRVADARLLPWDALGSLAHAAALRDAGVLGVAEHRRLHRELVRAYEGALGGAFRIRPSDEDAHAALERRLVRRLGDLGRKIHTGRSRNDQVLAAMRLLEKDALLEIAAETIAAAEALARFARRHRRTVWPGYTHLRRAMPSTVGLWAAAYAEGLLDDVDAILAATERLDRSPLGSGAGFGVPLRLDRARTARRLGFRSAQRNVASVQPSRGKLEAVALAALWAAGSTLAKWAWDVVLFSAEEYGYLRLPASLATGSSIMPHKRNPDVFELIRAREGVLAGCLAQVLVVAGKLPGGYHRDLQMLKGPIFAALDTARETARMAALAIPRLEVDRARCAGALGRDALATDEVYRRVRAGTPFRVAYGEVAEEFRDGRTDWPLSPAAILAARGGPGEAGDPSLAALGSDLRARRNAVAARRRAFAAALGRLVGRPGARR